MRQFQAAQKKWQAYRAAQCEFEAPRDEIATIMPTIWANCMATAAWNRIDELKFNLCEGRGMTGECEASRRYDRPAPH